ncbi:copper chaperone PCu(A)C [Actinomycetota bacterium Odt1-20B]
MKHHPYHRTNRRALACGAIALTGALALTGCSDSDSGSKDTKTKAAEKAGAKPAIKVSDAFMPAPSMPSMASGFFTLKNTGGADKLTSVTSDIAAAVTLHSTKNNAMKEEKSFDVPAGGELDFARGGNHLMFEKLKHKPKQGDKVEVTLHFQKSDPITVTVPVKEATYNPKPHQH